MNENDNKKKDEFGFLEATQPEILKLNEKDGEYINELKLDIQSNHEKFKKKLS